MQRAEVDAARARRTVHDDVGGVAEHLRAEHVEGRAADRDDQHDHEAQPLRAEQPAEAAHRVAEPLDRLGRDADAAAGPEGRPARLRAGSGEQLLVVVEVGLGGHRRPCNAPCPTPVSSLASSLVPLPPMFSSVMPRSSRRSATARSRRTSGSRDQLVVRAAADDHAVFEHEDVVGVGDRRHPLRHDHDRGVLRVRAERGAQPGVGGEVERRERVVEHVDVGLRDERPGDRQPLALPARHVGAALLDPLSSPPGIACTKSVACATSSAAHISSSVASGLPNCRLLATVPEKRYGRCGTKPIVLHSTSGSRSRTSTPPTSTVPSVLSNSRRMRLTSVVLPAPVLPTIAVVWPARRRERDVGEHRVLGARVVEADVVELERAVLADVAYRVDRRDDAPVGVEHLLDAVGRHRGARDHRDHERGHHDRHQDLHEVGEVRDQRADLDLARVDAVGAEPQHGDARHVDEQVHRREHRRHQAAGAQRHVA